LEDTIIEPDNWVFKENRNVMVISTKSIIERKCPILSVWHDADDGMWQFLDSSDVDEGDAVLISLEEIVNLDISISEISDLPLGWVAWRREKGDVWKKQEQNDAI